MNSTMAWMTQQILQMDQTPVHHHRDIPSNAFPNGMERGSTTWRAHVLLLSVYPRSVPCAALRRSCNAGRGAVSWALRYLADHGAIEKLPHPRHPQYNLYRAVL